MHGVNFASAILTEGSEEKKIRCTAGKSQVSVPLIVGGGIRTRERASLIAKAGADVVVTGTIVEKAEKVYDALMPIIQEIKSVN